MNKRQKANKIYKNQNETGIILWKKGGGGIQKTRHIPVAGLTIAFAQNIIVLEQPFDNEK